MIHEILQDPDWASYENLFFFLSLGKYDTKIQTNQSNCHIEEFLILGELWKDHIEYLKKMVDILTLQFIGDRLSSFPMKIDPPVEYRIFMILYTTPNTGRLIGIGIRIITTSSNVSSLFAPCSEERLQKAMYLISRGLLNSYHHQIEQMFCTLPL